MWLEHESRRQARAGKLFTLTDVEHAAQPALALLSMVRDGRVREAAVRKLALDAIGLHALIIRFDDVVEPISNAVCERFLAALRVDRIRDLVPLLPFVDRPTAR